MPIRWQSPLSDQTKLTYDAEACTLLGCFRSQTLIVGFYQKSIEGVPNLELLVR